MKNNMQKKSHQISINNNSPYQITTLNNHPISNHNFDTEDDNTENLKNYFVYHVYKSEGYYKGFKE